MPLSQPERNYVMTEFAGSRILSDGDAFQLLISNDPAAVNITVPPDVFGAGVQISVLQYGVGIPTFVAGAGVTIQSAGTLIMTAQYGIATLIRLPDEFANEWILAGAV